MASISATCSNNSFWGTLEYSERVDENNNKSIITATLKVSSNQWGSFYGYTTSGTISIDGENFNVSTSSNLGLSSTITVGSVSKDVYHDDNGNKTISIGFSVSNGYIGSASNSTSWTLTHIDRYALITEVPATITDEGEIWFKYNNPRGLEMRSWLEINPNSTHYAERTITGTSGTGTYTYELTIEERNQLRARIPNSNTGTIRIGIKSTLNNVEYASYKDKTFTIINANPEIDTPTYSEQNAKVSALLGSSATTVVQNASILRTTITPTALKSSTINKVSITHNGVPYEDSESPYVIDVPVSTNTFTINVIDSRTNTSTETITKTMLDYLPVDITTFNFKRVNPTSSNILVSMEATYYQQTFGSTTNAPVVKWKLDEGNWTTIPSTEYTIDNTNHKLTITNYQLTNILDYRNNGQFYLSIEDELTADQESGTNGYVLKGIPTFDAGEHDFKVNGTLYVADEDGQNKVDVLSEITNLKPIELYNDTTGTTGNVQLSETADNFTYLEIFYKCNQYIEIYNSVKVYMPNQKRVSLTSIQVDNTAFGIYSAYVNINGTTITRANGGNYWTNGTYSHTDYIYITRVIGYKEEE